MVISLFKTSETAAMIVRPFFRLRFIVVDCGETCILSPSYVETSVMRVRIVEAIQFLDNF